MGECQKAIDWSNKMAKEWLRRGMFDGEPDAAKKADAIVRELGDHAVTLSHARHLPIERCREIGLKAAALEDDQDLQERVLSVHHACMLTLTATSAFKLIENQNGIAFIKLAQTMVVAAQGPN